MTRWCRQRGLPQWEPDHPALMRLKARRCSTLDESRAWVADEVRREKESAERQNNTDKHRQTRTDTDGEEGVWRCRCKSVFVRVSQGSPGGSRRQRRAYSSEPLHLPAGPAAQGTGLGVRERRRLYGTALWPTHRAPSGAEIGVGGEASRLASVVRFGLSFLGRTDSMYPVRSDSAVYRLSFHNYGKL